MTCRDLIGSGVKESFSGTLPVGAVASLPAVIVLLAESFGGGDSDLKVLCAALPTLACLQ